MTYRPLSFDLAPCPCGHIGTTRNNTNCYSTWWVQCTKCSWRTAGDTEAEAIAAWNDRPTNDEMLVKALRLVSKILPSAAGLDDAPHSEIIACYMSMGEMRAIKNAISTLKEAQPDD